MTGPVGGAGICISFSLQDPKISRGTSGHIGTMRTDQWCIKSWVEGEEEEITIKTGFMANFRTKILHYFRRKLFRISPPSRFTILEGLNFKLHL